MIQHISSLLHEVWPLVSLHLSIANHFILSTSEQLFQVCVFFLLNTHTASRTIVLTPLHSSPHCVYVLIENSCPWFWSTAPLTHLCEAFSKWSTTFCVNVAIVIIILLCYVVLFHYKWIWRVKRNRECESGRTTRVFFFCVLAWAEIETNTVSFPFIRFYGCWF